MRHYYTIGEISKLYSIGTDSLRYYEEAGLLFPKRAENGYRMYSISDIWRLNIIRDMLKLDFSTARIKEYLDTRTVDRTLALLSEERSIIDAQMAELEQKRRMIAERQESLLSACARETEAVSVISLKERHCIRMSGTVRLDEEVDYLIKKLHKKHESELFLIRGGTIGALIDESAMRERTYDMFSCAFKLYSGAGDFILPAGDYVSVCYRGASKNTSRLMPLMEEYAKERGRSLTGAALEIYLIDVHESCDPSEYVTELQWLLSPASS